jgi:FkbM family methyltransferase
MDALYAQFVKPDDLAFDIGAHVGDRTASFRRLGARVVALEPQPGPAAILRCLFGRDRTVTLLRQAASGAEGELTLYTNSRNPTVSTLSSEFIRAAQGVQNWEGQRWDGSITVPVTTLDALIAAYGLPAFIKIDVEGYEGVVLSGLTTPVPALSFEFTTIAPEVAIACLDRLEEIDDYRYNVSVGESQVLVFPDDVTAQEMRCYIIDAPHTVNSGDVYARRRSTPVEVRSRHRFRACGPRSPAMTERKARLLY